MEKNIQYFQGINYILLYNSSNNSDYQDQCILFIKSYFRKYGLMECYISRSIIIKLGNF